ncbi:MAG: aminotransferase class V-fold PLP-dependent enzyme [Candidatus Delongbacteria bacterium]|nr:aminotransferase class V-fold PLP-dependent enzyme [Candidatus Delongbacteria bacterium]
MCECYLDYAATTPVDPHIAELYHRALLEQWHNPSAAYAHQLAASIHQVKHDILQTLGLGPDYDLIVTSGATESINTILKGITDYRIPAGTLLSTSIEHSAVTETLEFIRHRLRGTIVVISPDRNGLIDPEQLKSKLTPDLKLCSFIVVQNEIGTIQPIRELYRIVKTYNPSIPVHLDAAQAFGKLPLAEFIPYADFISFSGHKFFVPKGIGGLIHRKNNPPPPLIHGGGQQNNLRGGTLNFPLILALYHGIKAMVEHQTQRLDQCRQISRYLEDQITRHLPQARINIPSGIRVPHIWNISIPGIKGETIRNTLASHQIWVSTGSACSTHRKKKNILAKLNRNQEVSESSIRISLSHLTQPEQIDRLIRYLLGMVQERIVV